MAEEDLLKEEVVTEEVKTPEEEVSENLLEDKVDDSVEEPKEEVKEEEPEVKEPEVKEENTEHQEVSEEDTQEGQSEDPAPLPEYEAFELPEGSKVDEERMKSFTGLLGEYERNNKSDHTMTQELGQKLVNLHIEELNKAADTWVKDVEARWENQKKAWREDFLGDEEYGGKRWQTTVNKANEAIRAFGGNAEHQKEFREVMISSGLQNHKAVLRFLSNLVENNSSKIIPASKPVPHKSSKVEAMYGKQS